MDIYVTNTARGLVPNYDSDFDEKKKLKIGVVYKAKIVKARNYEFHKKYFALINCAWEYQDEKVERFFNGNADSFRKTIEIAAGHCDKVYSIDLNSWIDIPKSISFGKMNELDFQDLYDRVKKVLFSTFLKHIREDDFLNDLINF